MVEIVVMLKFCVMLMLRTVQRIKQAR